MDNSSHPDQSSDAPASLRQRIGELERELRACQQTIGELRRSEEQHRVFLEYSPDPIVVYDTEGMVLYLNPAFVSVFGWTLDELRGKRIDFVPPEHMAETIEGIKRIYETNTSVTFDTRRCTKDGQLLDMHINASMILDDQGQRAGMIVSLRDITAENRIREEQQRLQDELLAVQAAALAELSTPIIPITRDILVMPLIGAIDDRRIQQVMETLLHGVGEQRARMAILDITGVPIVDSQVANGLIAAAQAARLLGAQVMITGIKPEVAQALVGIGVDLGQIITHSSLQSGIAHAVGKSWRG